MSNGWGWLLRPRSMVWGGWGVFDRAEKTALGASGRTDVEHDRPEKTTCGQRSASWRRNAAGEFIEDNVRALEYVLEAEHDRGVRCREDVEAERVDQSDNHEAKNGWARSPPSDVFERSEPPPTSPPHCRPRHGDAIDTSLAATGTAFGGQLSGQPRACYPPLRLSLVPRRSCHGAEAALFRAGQKIKQVASVSNPLVKHFVELRLSAAYRHSCRCLLLVGLVPIL
ncbi:hypothetical protein PR202_ga13040 [Eleusine coracana subsp. coracana]|uniref:Uncharacterized protein n=1 Tax=Eleusine coracana subsp. coracana TaxID=191504 RepID=A0AAV5CDA6_ELECO|nr:hypothetical protein PR202_ga13040 [Eleusine coracana subsp. coracana]